MFYSYIIYIITLLFLNSLNITISSPPPFYPPFIRAQKFKDLSRASDNQSNDHPPRLATYFEKGYSMARRLQCGLKDKILPRCRGVARHRLCATTLSDTGTEGPHRASQGLVWRCTVLCVREKTASGKKTGCRFRINP